MPGPYFPQVIVSESGDPPTQSIERLTGGVLMRGQDVIAAMRNQDAIVASCRRAVVRVDNNGVNGWTVPDTDPGTEASPSPTRTHPDRTTERVFGRCLTELTPGCFYMVSILHTQSGETQEPATPSGFKASGVYGAVVINATWYDRDGGSIATTDTIGLAGNTDQYGAEPSGDVGLLTSLFLSHTWVQAPQVTYSNIENTRWSRFVSVDIELAYVGGARVVTAVLTEYPWRICLEADLPSEDWVSHIYSTSNPRGPGINVSHPLQRVSEAASPNADPRGGTWHMIDVAKNQARRLGAHLFDWHATEEENDTDLIQYTPGGPYNGAMLGFLNSAQTGYDADQPGWSVSSGGFSRDWKNNSPFVLFDRIAVIPVRVRVYGSVDTGSATVRIMTAADSYVDLTITTTTDAWTSVYGWLAVGVTPIQPIIAQAFVELAPGTTFDLRDICCYYADPVRAPQV